MLSIGVMTTRDVSGALPASDMREMRQIFVSTLLPQQMVRHCGFSMHSSSAAVVMLTQTPILYFTVYICRMKDICYTHIMLESYFYMLF